MGSDQLLQLTGMRGEAEDHGSAQEAGMIPVDRFAWGATRTDADASHFDGRLLTADDFTRDQAARAEFEAFGGGFLGGVVVAAGETLGRDLLLGSDGADAQASHERYLTYTLSDTLIGG